MALTRANRGRLARLVVGAVFGAGTMAHGVRAHREPRQSPGSMWMHAQARSEQQPEPEQGHLPSRMDTDLWGEGGKGGGRLDGWAGR